LSTETEAHDKFCRFIKSKCPGMNATSNLSPIFQESNRIEDLYFMAHASNALFQDVFEFLVSKSDVVPGSLKLCGNVFVKCLESAKEDILKAQLNPGACRLVRGPVKRPDRAIAKVYRAYGGDVSKLTDLVRCSLSFDSFANMQSFTKAFFSLCSFQNSQEPVASSGNISTAAVWPRRPQSSLGVPLLERANDSDNRLANDSDNRLANDSDNRLDDSNYRLFRIERIRNRFDSSYQSPSAYRDFSIKVTIGIQASTQGRYALAPVRDWHEKTEKASADGKKASADGKKASADGSARRNKSVSLFTCEVQLHHRGIELDDENGLVHDNYVAMRNLVSS